MIRTASQQLRAAAVILLGKCVGDVGISTLAEHTES